MEVEPDCEDLMMRVLERDFDIDAFLAKPLLAHLATRDEAGAYETPVWYLWENQALWMIGGSSSSFPRRLQSDPRAAIGITEFDLQKGFLRHLGLRGEVELRPFDGERRDRLIRRYLGREDTWNEWFRDNVINRQDILLKFIPKTALARDQSYFRFGDATNKVRI